MPVTVLQSNAGGFNATSGNATLGSGTTAGTTLLLIVGTASSFPSTNPPTGFTPANGDGPVPATTNKVMLFRKTATAGETSWAITVASAQLVCWSVLEVDGLDASTPKDVTVSTFQNGTAVTSQSTGTTATATTYDGFAVAAHFGQASTTTIPTWSGQTNGFAEVTDAGVAGASTAAGMAVSTLSTQTPATFSCTATASASVGAGATVVVYTAANARRVANVQMMAGFEWGTAAGLATGSAGNLIFDSIGGSPAIVTTAPRSGAYCLELSSSAAAEYVQWSGTPSLGSASQILVARFGLLFPSSLPSGDLDLFNISVASGTSTANQAVTLRYRSASQSLGLQVRAVTDATNGTEQLSASTVSPDTWYGVDVRYDGTSSTTYLADWQLDGVAQTQATATGTVAPSVGGVSLGWFGASTATVRYDDVVLSRTAGHFPLGDMRILPVKPDPAGTLTISGTTANFNTFTANGTMAAWNAATALTAISDLPPTISASADGIAQVTAAATDYVNIPMDTYNAAGNNAAVRAVRMYAAGWAASTTAATLAFRGFDGTTETALTATANPTFSNSTTAPGWVAKIYKPTSGWTQTQLDALAFRVGFSDDATPDIGIHSIMAEVCVRAGQSQTMFGAAGDVQVTATTDPDSAGLISLTSQGADYKGMQLTYDVSGTPTNATVAPGGNRTDTIGAPDAPTVDYVAIYPDPEGVADA